MSGMCVLSWMAILARSHSHKHTHNWLRWSRDSSSSTKDTLARRLKTSHFTHNIYIFVMRKWRAFYAKLVCMLSADDNPPEYPPSWHVILSSVPSAICLCVPNGEYRAWPIAKGDWTYSGTTQIPNLRSIHSFCFSCSLSMSRSDLLGAK